MSGELLELAVLGGLVLSAAAKAGLRLTWRRFTAKVSTDTKLGPLRARGS